MLDAWHLFPAVGLQIFLHRQQPLPPLSQNHRQRPLPSLLEEPPTMPAVIFEYLQSFAIDMKKSTEERRHITVTLSNGKVLKPGSGGGGGGGVAEKVVAGAGTDILQFGL